MARIKNNLTGDVFEAPARDFANEADFTIVDSSTPITAEAPVVAGDAGNDSSTVTDSGTSTVLTPIATSVIATTAATVGADNSQSTASTSSDGTKGNAAAGAASTSGGSGASANGAGDLGNVQGSTSANSAASQDDQVGSTSSAPASAPDSAAASPAAPTLDTNGKHIVTDQLESDLLFAVAQLVTVNDSIKHAADAFFGQVHSLIDAQAAQ